VWLSEEEAIQMAKHLGISEKEFLKKYTRLVSGKLALLEKRKDAETYDCIFLKDKQCMIYPVRPKQCQTFPWWPENLSSKEAWEGLSSYCEGINHNQAPLISLKEIQKELGEKNE
jgi:Fe-S-cluster containining protein